MHGHSTFRYSNKYVKTTLFVLVIGMWRYHFQLKLLTKVHNTSCQKHVMLIYKKPLTIIETKHITCTIRKFVTHMKKMLLSLLVDFALDCARVLSEGCCW